MGRHRRRQHSGAGRRPGGALLGASAVMAVGAAAVASGLSGALPHTGGPVFGGVREDPPGGPLRADGNPSSVLPGAQPTRKAQPTGTEAAPASGTASTSAVPGGPASTPSARPTVVVRSRPPTAAGTPSASAAVSPTPTVTATAPAGPSEVNRVIAAVNAERAKAGCRPLTPDPRLARLAQGFSDEMAVRGFFGHTDPGGRSPWDRAAALGITDLGGENIARGQADADAVMESWMNSPGHRANILDCDYRTIGVGLHPGDGGPWWTQDFGY